MLTESFRHHDMGTEYDIILAASDLRIALRYAMTKDKTYP